MIAQLAQEAADAGGSAGLEHVVQRLEPLAGFERFELGRVLRGSVTHVSSIDHLRSQPTIVLFVRSPDENCIVRPSFARDTPTSAPASAAARRCSLVPSCRANAARACARTADASRRRRSARIATTRTGAARCPGFGDPDARLLLVGPGAGRAWRQPHRTRVHRATAVRRLPDVGAASDRLREHPHVAACRRRTAARTTRTSCRRCAARRPTTSRCPKRSRAASIISTRKSRTCRDVRVVVALGKIGFDAWLQLLQRRGVRLSPRPQFGHGVVVRAWATACRS